MQNEYKKVFFWLKRHEVAAIWSGILVISAFIFWLCAAKYARFGYNGIDLAYFNQVFWNTVRGRLFQQSIHPHLSLGDHAEFIILGLAPLYAIWQDPRMLLALQALALAACAWPIWLLAREGSSARRAGLVPLGFALVSLINPVAHNIALFEFHILPFAIFPLLMAALAYRRGRTIAFIAWSVGALFVREDAALVVIAFALLAWIEKRALWWRITPAALGAGWFLAAMTLIRQFAPGGGYKFSIYYAWLFDSWRQPWEIFAHVLSFANFEMLLGFLMATAFLPIFGWRPLVLAAAPLAQMILGAPGGGAIVLETHYASLFVPALVLASIDGYAKLSDWLARRADSGWIMPARDARIALPVFLLLVTVYSTLTLGPLPVSLERAFAPVSQSTIAARNIVDLVPSGASVAASYALLPSLSSREQLYSAHYLYLGVTQFAYAPYAAPSDLEYLVFDDRNLELYDAQFRNTAWAVPFHADGLKRLSAVAAWPVAREGTFAFYRTTSPEASAGNEKPAATPVLGLPMSIHTTNEGARIYLDGDRSIMLR